MFKHYATLALVALLATPGFAFTSSSFEGTVVGVADGDTLTVLHDGIPSRVRLLEIDAPEKAQPFGAASKKSLSDLCFQKPARVESAGLDRYGRTLGRVFCSGVDANARQVQMGMAWAYDGYSKDQNIYALQAVARTEHLGLWADAAPVKPWEFRRAKKVLASASRAAVAPPGI